MQGLAKVTEQQRLFHARLVAAILLYRVGRWQARKWEAVWCDRLLWGEEREMGDKLN